MSLRRRSSRLQVLNADGVLRVWRDVVGHRTAGGDYLVVSNEAGIKGERVTVYLASGEPQPIPVRVVDSRPIVRHGSVQHELRLSPLENTSSGSLDTSRGGNREAE
ncbi:MAG TPA: hypothetical protein VL882_14130 [Vicinamibacterales bacterium]|jgi:hypothetical protein|nr:hypothetical protein [Vicinamibacterales bacterium]